jgi:hypothetical protein
VGAVATAGAVAALTLFLTKKTKSSRSSDTNRCAVLPTPRTYPALEEQREAAYYTLARAYNATGAGLLRGE